MPHLFEPLESRLFLSAAPHKASATIIMDMQAIVAAKDQITHDTLACKAMIISDRSAIPTTRAADQAMIKDDQLKLRADRGNSAAVAADRLQIDSDRLKLRQDLLSIQTTIARDNAGCKDTLKADHVALKQAQLQLRLDRIAGR